MAETNAPQLTDDRAIMRAGLVIGVLSIVAKLSAFVREAIIASLFGRSVEVDAFFLALAVPVFLMSLIAYSFQIALVPAYLAERRAAGETSANALAAAGIARIVVILALAALVMAALAPLYLPILAPTLSPRALTLTADMLWIMTLFVVFSGAALAWAGVLNAQRRFALPAIAPIFTPLVMAGLLLAARDAMGIIALAWGAVIGTAIEAGLLATMVWRVGGPIWPRWRGPNLDALWRRWWPVMLATLLLSGAALIDQMMAAFLGPGSVSAIGYGTKLVVAGLHVASLALGVAVLPAYADGAAVDPGGLRRQLRRHLAIVILLSIPAVALAALIAEPVIALLYQRGAFGPDDTALVSNVLTAYAVQLPAYTATVILVRAAAVLERGGALAAAAAANVMLTILLNAVFMNVWGVVGIALATAPAFAATALLLYIPVDRALARTAAA